MRAVEIAKQVSSGEISARSVLEQHFETINNLETQVNAFNIVTIEEKNWDPSQVYQLQ